MFDQETRQLIQNAPAISDIDTDRLPEELSQFFVEIASLRLTMASGIAQLDNGLRSRLMRLRELASTYASYVAAGVAVEQTEPAAYVSGTAFRLLAEATAVAEPPTFVSSEFSAHQVPDAMSAIVLLLIAGYPADATEVGRFASGSDVGSTEAAVLRNAICSLADTRFEDAVGHGESAQSSRFEYFDTANNDEQYDRDVATNLLWLRLAEGVGLLCAQLLSEATAIVTPASVFEEVMNLSLESVSLDQGNDDGVTIESAFSGPYFLAALLRRLSDELPPRGVVHTPSPSGVEPNDWSGFVRGIAASRPLLWHNHLQAVNSGFLDCGMSSVISFPTGAGKSTLAELKIAPYLLSGSKVIFLAPTHALSHQVRASLRTTFPEHKIHDSVIGDGFYAELGDDESTFADVTVMTPERCLMLLDLHPAAFEEIGLVIIDECHILHPSRGPEDRRAIDAMLALLRLVKATDDADFVLLSAMMSNAHEISEWISTSFGRSCMALDLRWKPTRQAKGCLVYGADEITVLRSDITTTRKSATTKGPPKALKQRQLATPYGLFSLRQTWNSNDVDDFRFCRLTPQKLPLDINARWQLTNNKNSAAELLAAEFAKRGIKTIVFSQNKLHCEKMAANADGSLPPESTITLTDEERVLLDAAIEEAGGSEHALLPHPKGCSCHHGLLNSVERALAESVFRRADGGRIIIATPTLAQGMNLPAEAVIIAGAHRFDATNNARELMDAHDLLNAAGRSGRAGFRPEGIVLLITDSPVEFDVDENSTTIGRAWFELKDSIFSKEDQCLSIQDPVELMLDEIALSTEALRGTPAYFANRLPIGSDKESTASLLRRSLGAFKAQAESRSQDFNEQIQTAIGKRRELLLDGKTVSWADELASSNGVPAIIFKSIGEELSSLSGVDDWTVLQWIEFTFSWAKSHLKLADRMLDRSAVKKILGTPESTSPIPADAISTLESVFNEFLAGSTLAEIEAACPPAKRSNPYCHRARELTQRTALDVSYLVGLFPQIYRALQEHDSVAEPQVPTALAVASACARDGFSSAEMLALSILLRRRSPEITRCRVHREFHAIQPHLAPGELGEKFETVSQRVSLALDAVHN
jgi:superfamily II DNA/RNA helicase